MSPRAVLDTNVVVFGERSASPTSPGREILERWLNGRSVVGAAGP